MYSNESILILNDRIGWDAFPADTVVVSAGNLTGTSGRKVNSFHQLATTENLYSAVQVVEMDEA